MGFSDSLGKITGAIQGLMSRGAVAKGSSGSFRKKAKKGELSDSQSIFAGLGFGVTQEQIDERGNLNAKNVLSADLKALEGSAYAAHGGHQLYRALSKKRKSSPMPGSVKKKPSQGAGTTQAKRQAKQRALVAASQRRGKGLGSTVATSPLGLQGDGAATSRRSLIGE